MTYFSLIDNRPIDSSYKAGMSLDHVRRISKISNDEVLLDHHTNTPSTSPSPSAAAQFPQDNQTAPKSHAPSQPQANYFIFFGFITLMAERSTHDGNHGKLAFRGPAWRGERGVCLALHDAPRTNVHRACMVRKDWRLLSGAKHADRSFDVGNWALAASGGRSVKHLHARVENVR
ncbi:hypothetical protein BU24DRAFT_7135 [Aaosphaeria arxii CBS 175.79]|uniref:Uncharacterized protein n=1 Tax=Aaosphaeria arxii CBS 175.79 TaxID=1450172 RepID=A0A6A5Y7D4_9PLEO|nr:uncharacterized protein BU24DRAFT_7135 [Aaosphaeria arxii CBS 175.79]KAF2020710.1 hypothetical protein BU24DRAFT_7135 [Aaosphaeria arxii CBS 175.79]